MADSDKKKPKRSGETPEPGAVKKKRPRPTTPASDTHDDAEPRNTRAVRATDTPIAGTAIPVPPPSSRTLAAANEALPRRKVPQPERSPANVAEDMAGTHHGPSMGVYFGIFAMLLVLTGVTVAAAFVDLGVMGPPVAVLIAAVKATVVVLWFMHVKYASRLIGLYAASGFLFLAIMLGITMAEVGARAPAGPIDPLAPASRPAAPPPTGGHANPPSMRPDPSDEH